MPNLEDISKRRLAVMTKTDIIDNIREKVGLPKADIAEIVKSVFDIIMETAQREDKIVISRFGIFASKKKRARRGRNPKTGDRMEISPRRVLTSKPSLVLKASVNRATGEIEADQKTDEISGWNRLPSSIIPPPLKSGPLCAREVTHRAS